MNRASIGRRNFLKGTCKALLATPAISTLGRFAEAQAPAKPVRTGQATSAAKRGVTLNVRDLGATGDGKTKDTLAIQQTIERCSVLGGGEVVVPAGDFLTGALALRSNVVLRIEQGGSLLGSPDMADYPLAQIRWEGKWIKGHLGFLSAMDADNIGIVGPGKIVGSEAVKGRIERPSNLRLPALMEFTNCKNVRVENCYTQQYGMWSIHPVYCENISFKNVIVKSGADGIDVDSCKHVTIDGCDFETGDDCISLKSGRGQEANTIARPTEDVTISNCTFVDHNFACIGIGSEVSAGVRNVRIEHCKFNGAHSHAIYIKSRPGRGAFIEDIAANDLDVSGVGAGFLRINNLNSGKHDEVDVPGDEGITTFKNFSFTNVRVKDVPHLVQATEIHPTKPLDGLTLANISGTCAKGIALANVKNARLSEIAVTGYDGALLSTVNVRGTGLAGAVAGEAPKVPDAVPAPATPYQLH
jgi:polygalacturonase